LTSIYKTENIF